MGCLSVGHAIPMAHENRLQSDNASIAKKSETSVQHFDISNLNSNFKNTYLEGKTSFDGDNSSEFRKRVNVKLVDLLNKVTFNASTSKEDHELMQIVNCIGKENLPYSIQEDFETFSQKQISIEKRFDEDTQRALKLSTQKPIAVPVQTSGEDLKCGYHAIAIGLLGLPKDFQSQLFEKIGYSEKSLSGDIQRDQLSLGKSLYEYSKSVLPRTIESKLNEMGLLGNDRKSFHREMSAETNIFESRLKLLCNSLGIHVVLNGESEINGAFNIRIFNPIGGHYTGTQLQ